MKTIGSIDKVLSRKTRSDLGSKRTKYKGKPVIGRKKRKYVKKISDKTGLWLRAYWRIPMTSDGYKNWKPWLRTKVYKEITNMKMSPTFREVPFEYINTKEKFVNFFVERLWEGKFVIMGGSSGKTKTHFKPVNICTIRIKETPNGNVGTMIQNKRLSKYKWFYKG